MNQEIVATDFDPAAVRSGDLIYGVKALAAHLGTTRRQAQYLVEKGVLPVWREGKIICARRETIRKWIIEREASGIWSGRLPVGACGASTGSTARLAGTR